MEKTSLSNKITIWLYALFAAGIFLFLLIFFLISRGALGFMPRFEELENPHSNLATEIYSADGALLGSFFQENRSRVEYDEISPNVIKALVSTEDIRFYEIGRAHV